MRNIVIVGGVSFWSEYHFVETPGHKISYPGIAHDFQHTFDELHALPCDVFLGAHGAYFDLLAKLQRYKRKGPSVFIDRAGYKQFVNNAEANFKTELRKQKAAAR
jgi:metallo-beta-lactamase class B